MQMYMKGQGVGGGLVETGEYRVNAEGDPVCCQTVCSGYQ